MSQEFEREMTFRIDEHVERLVVRYLDGACTPKERAEVERLMSVEPAVAALCREYAAIDALSRGALNTVLVTPTRIAGTNADRRIFDLRDWLAGFGVMAAAAALAFWFAPSLGPAPVSPAHPGVVVERDHVADGGDVTFVADRGVDPEQARLQWMPHERHVDTQRDLIGVIHPETQRVYFIGLDRQAVHTRPVVYSD